MEALNNSILEFSARGKRKMSFLLSFIFQSLAVIEKCWHIHVPQKPQNLISRI